MTKVLICGSWNLFFKNTGRGVNWVEKRCSRLYPTIIDLPTLFNWSMHKDRKHFLSWKNLQNCDPHFVCFIELLHFSPFPIFHFIPTPLPLSRLTLMSGEYKQGEKIPLLRFLNIINLQHVAAIMGRFLHSLTNWTWVCIFERKKWIKA